MVINENGKDAPHVINQTATDIAHEAEAIQRDDYIAGDAVISRGSAMRQPTITTDSLLVEIRALIDEARTQVARAANSALTLTYWRIGRRIGNEILGGERAAYGGQIVVALARQLESEYGQGFGA